MINALGLISTGRRPVLQSWPTSKIPVARCNLLELFPDASEGLTPQNNSMMKKAAHRPAR